MAAPDEWGPQEHALAEVFAPIAALLPLCDARGLGGSCRAAALRLRGEVARREALSKTLYVWASNNRWSHLFAATRCVDWRLEHWCELPPMSEARTGAISALIGDCLYVCGGSRRGLPTNSAERLCLATGKWVSLPPLLGRRRVDADGCASAVLAGQLYICGGLDFSGDVGSTCGDCFDPEQHQWETLPPMPERRCRAAAATVDGRLYICGGSSARGSATTALSSVIRLDTEAKVWEAVPSMLEKRSGPAVVVANNTIYVGQCDSKLSECSGGMPLALTAGERFNVETGRWSRCVPGLLSTPGASAASALRGCLFICGGSAEQASRRGPARRVAGTDPTAAAASPGGALAVPPGAAIGARTLRRNWTT